MFTWLIYNKTIVQLPRKILVPIFYFWKLYHRCNMKEIHAHESYSDNYVENYNYLEIGNLSFLEVFYFKHFLVETHWFVFLFIFHPSRSKFDIFITAVECLVFIRKTHLTFTSKTPFHFYKWNIMGWAAYTNLMTSLALLFWLPFPRDWEFS